MNAFNRTAKIDNSVSAIISRLLTAAFSVAVIGAVGAMTTVQYVASMSI